ncbi:MAG TPA: hypothetical protein VGQ83_39455, partial [Polyangia bacterium]
LARLSVTAADLDKIAAEASSGPVPARAPEAPTAPAPGSVSGRVSAPVRATPSAKMAAAPPTQSGRVSAPVRPRLSARYLSGDEPQESSANSLIAEAMTDAIGGDAKRPRLAAGPDRFKVVKLAVVGALIAAALGFLGARLFAPPGSAFPIDRFAAVLKLDAARRFDHAVEARLADSRWDAMPPADRKKAMDELLRRMEPEGVRSVVVRDATGATRGLASTLGGERVVRVQ